MGRRGRTRRLTMGRQRDSAGASHTRRTRHAIPSPTEKQGLHRGKESKPTEEPATTTISNPPKRDRNGCSNAICHKDNDRVAARSDQMYRGYLDRVAEKNQMMEEIRREVRKGM